MAKRRANGEGNIRKRADGRWEGRYTAGHDPVTGKQIFKNVLGRSQAEVKEKLSAAIKETAGLDLLRAEQYTVASWLQFWLDNFGKMTMRPSTFESYSGNLRVHIKPNIGIIQLTKLCTSDLQKFYSKLLTEGRIVRKESENQPKGLSPKTVRNVHIFISTALDKAVAEKLIPYNPAKSCTLPKGEHTEMKTLPLDRIAAFFAEAKKSGVYEMYLLEIATGLRRGELLGLKWTDVHYDTGTIHVQRQICRIEGAVTEGPLKTKNSYRKIVVPADVMAVLKDKQKKDNGASEYVFFSPITNGPISPSQILSRCSLGARRIALYLLTHSPSLHPPLAALGSFPRQRPARLRNIVALPPWSGVIAPCFFTQIPRFIRHRRRFGIFPPRAGPRRIAQHPLP